jgi:predicted Rossmann fold flavoprotein
MRVDVIILGAGAAGLMCSIEAAKRGKTVALLERGEKVGKKILISGGGRCNFTNRHCTAANFLSTNPHFMKSALARYTQHDFIALVEKHGIAYHEKTLGQLFCDGSAREIVEMFHDEYDRVGVEVFLNCDVGAISKEELFRVGSNLAEFEAPSLVVATGGPSIPKMGATSFGYRIAKQFGLNVVAPYPALVPLTLTEADQERYCDLSGISAEVIATASGQSFREKMLITHRGLSGPAILQISSYWKPGETIELDLQPDPEQYLPKRFAQRWAQFNPPDTIHNWTIKPNGTEGYAKAEVTGGGIDTNELSSKTFESKKVSGLYFIGEVVDVTGHLGGFNFQWAWSSGYCAGQFV